ncbi:polysaccharide deacetylase family protein [Hymenobacter artigasi]|uniref:Peptidoglycan/xylan/chitin deacetylase (PgdA/CDA1 family)/glycosyltransferase involved in cell wall biosynthesis n=1 Tax=Hymenobacter artigasi TaxID=2719616 RepID=A0ABX1HQ08_9BACT|nr:polysaccharide deacetylase family protein [Hymenobacter artigasi]NKI91166.1 peptidoglycan/xylan/chitin deacetylase (PgdA/CDA1 family)/glycosyltransferase involved in cell wall biosynthesis [Hymenobacter artigasi]
MRILHVLSAEFFAGSVAYAVQLAEAHRAQGHQVWVVADADKLPTGATLVWAGISNRSYRQRLRNARIIRQLVKKERIDVVHCHSRAASWVSYFALRGLAVPLVSTVHGRQHLHTSTSLLDVYGDKVIAICANLREHLISEVKMDAAKIEAIPNGVAFGNEELASEDFALRISFIGRFNGGKGERAAALLAQVFPALLREFPALRVALIGGELEHLPAAGKTALAQLQADFGERIEVVGFSDDVPGWLACTTLVIGAGRVAIEALGAGRPVLALGEASYEGLVTEDTFAPAAASNFGDIAARLSASEVDFAALLVDAQGFLRQPQAVPAALRQQVQAHYSLATIAARVLEVYQAARMQKAVPGFIPVLMYHKIPDAPLATKHHIYVTKDNFEKHLAYFKKQNLTPITFADYLKYANGERSLADFPARPIILTFDDGYTDNYTNLLPLMQHYGYRGVLYLLGDADVRHNQWDLVADPTEPRSDIMDLAQKRAFVAAGWEIGAHTMSHPRLTTLPLPEAAAEIQRSKAALEADLQTEIVTFAYPYGDLNEAVKDTVREAGFALGIATDTGGLTIEADRMQVFRVNMFPNESTSSLFKKTSPWYRKYYRWKRGK